VKFAIRQPANFLYRSITSPWEARVTPEESLRDDVMALLERLKRAGATGAIVHLPPGTSGLDECIDWVAWFSREIIPEFRD
jgi:hypothetical protein